MKNVKLSTQFYIIFTVVILFTSLFFTLGMNYAFEDFQVQQNQEQLQTFNEAVYQSYVTGGLDSPFLTNKYNGFVIYENGVAVEVYQLDVLGGFYTTDQLYTHLNNWFSNEKVETFNEDAYYFNIIREDNTLVIGFTNSSYLENLGDSFNIILRISFISLVLLGNTLILIWSRIILDRIRTLQGEVTKLSQNNYLIPIHVEGNDEITELAKRIEKMRVEIKDNETTKQEMIQNISHDFKTPIAIIQSYAEAIRDGISDPKDTKIIIKQADVLNRKVKQLLELTKLEYDVTQQAFTPIKIKEVIKHIIDQQKYRRDDLTYKVKLDQSVYIGVYDHYYSAFSNIIDNMLRYAVSTIEIKLEKGVLTFYNDGESIDEKQMEKLFKPYEKGPKGQFGLGLSIVKRTMDLFHLQVTIKNVNQGVMFLIKPMSTTDKASSSETQ